LRAARLRARKARRAARVAAIRNRHSKKALRMFIRARRAIKKQHVRQSKWLKKRIAAFRHRSKALSDIYLAWIKKNRAHALTKREIYRREMWKIHH